MNQNEQTITKFYTAFKESDAAAMIDCYHDDVRFSDPVFPDLQGVRAKAMWRMFCVRKADPSTRWFEKVRADDTSGSAHWEAKYLFPGTTRLVHNKIDSKFKFKDGKIIEHVDSFDFWTWSQMAFGPFGALLGWTPFFRKFVQTKVAKKLDQFIATQNH